MGMQSLGRLDGQGPLLTSRGKPKKMVQPWGRKESGGVGTVEKTCAHSLGSGHASHTMGSPDLAGFRDEMGLGRGERLLAKPVSEFSGVHSIPCPVLAQGTLWEATYFIFPSLQQQS